MASSRRRMALPKLASAKLIRVDLKETCRQRLAAMDCSVRRTSSVVVDSFASLGKHPKRASLKTGHAAMKETLLLNHAATAWSARRITRKVGSFSARRRTALPKLASTKLIRVDLKETCRQRPAAMDCSVRRTSSVVVVSFASLGKHPKRASLK